MFVSLCNYLAVSLRIQSSFKLRRFIICILEFKLNACLVQRICTIFAGVVNQHKWRLGPLLLLYLPWKLGGVSSVFAVVVAGVFSLSGSTCQIHFARIIRYLIKFLSTFDYKCVLGHFNEVVVELKGLLLLSIQQGVRLSPRLGI